MINDTKNANKVKQKTVLETLTTMSGVAERERKHVDAAIAPDDLS